MTDKKEVVFIKEINPTEVYTATLEMRSVGMSQNMLPRVLFSHYFDHEPDADEIPYSYRFVLDLVEAIEAGKMMPTAEDLATFNSTNPDEDVVRMENEVQIAEAVEEAEDNTKH